MTIQQQAQIELATRELEKRYEKQRNSLYEFLLFYWKEEKKLELDENRHIKEICSKLEDVFYGKIKRLIINIPPRALKTEIVSRAFPARCLGKREEIKFMWISYSASLSQDNSWDCRAIYTSDTFKKVFPRVQPLKDDQNTKTHRENIKGGQYYASGSTGTITGKWCDIMTIDDPVKPNDANSDIVRVWVNNNFHNTLYSRLNNKVEGAIVIIMQRLHDDDLCWHLIEQEKMWEKRDKLVIKAIAEDDDEYRKKWESFFEKRFPLHILQEIKQKDPQSFSSQYQQEPTNRETQEFHEERFKYHGENTPNKTPPNLRIFTALDPAFKQGQENDQTSIMTIWFLWDEAYILEYTAGRLSATDVQDKIIYHIQKRRPEKVGIEAFQAQSMINTFLKNELTKRGIFANIEEIRQSGDKLSKIRMLIPLYRAGKIYHKTGMDELELEEKRFPRGKHDDIVDSLQMCYDLYQLQPNATRFRNEIQMSRDQFGNPIIR